MKTIITNDSTETMDIPGKLKDGCSHKSAGETLKMRLRTGMGLSDDRFFKTVRDILEDEKELVDNKVLAVQNLVRIQSADAEDQLLQIIDKKDARLSHEALKTLAFTGTEKTFNALQKAGTLPFKSLEQQKDFAMLFIGYKYGLPGTDPILNRLLADVHAAGKREEYPLRFRMMEAGDIASVLKQSATPGFGITLSRKTAFEIKVATQTFYFCFTNRFEEQASWREALQTKQVIGLLLKRQLHTTVITSQYIALVTPVKDRAQISIFRKNGELFMLAGVVYNREKDRFTVTNAVGEETTTKDQADFSIDQKAVVSMHLSYLRRNKKRKTEAIL